MLPQAVRYVLERLEDAGFAAYAVGGCVRDTLLGRAPPVGADCRGRDHRRAAGAGAYTV